MSCWDTTACLKTLCTAYNDYQKSTTDEAIKDLQRQIDVSIYWETTAIYIKTNLICSFVANHANLF